MATDRFDQTARYLARIDPEGFLGWLYPGFARHMHFERWLDTRTAPMPNQPNQTADTVGELIALHVIEPPWLMLLEFQTEPDPEMFGRLLEQLGKFWREHRPDALPGSRYQLVAAVVNLTGTLESLPASRQFTFPLRNCSLGLAAEERHLATESAATTLDAIASGETAKSILALIPLMTGGGEPGIIQRWLDIANTEPDHRKRDGLGHLALAMAELKPWFGEWQKALKEWTMRESTVIQGWIDRGIDRGRIEQARRTLNNLLVKRFGAVSPAIIQRIDATTDLTILEQATQVVFDVASLDALPL